MEVLSSGPHLEWHVGCSSVQVTLLPGSFPAGYGNLRLRSVHSFIE